MDNDPNGVTWLPAWKRYGYASREAWIESFAGASPPESASPGTNARAASRQGVSTDVAPDPAQTGAHDWPQEKPPPYARADDEGEETPHE